MILVLGTRKRKREENHATSDSTTQSSDGKGQVHEGFSWWTCLQYDMSMSKTRPHLVKKDTTTTSK